MRKKHMGDIQVRMINYRHVVEEKRKKKVDYPIDAPMRIITKFVLDDLLYPRKRRRL